MNEKIVTQSGFIANANDAFVLPLDTTSRDTLQAIKLGKALTPVTNPGYYHKGITELYDTYNKDERVMSDFAFRESVLKEALSCFNANSFLYWGELQSDKGVIDNTRRRFLNETFKFLSTGARSIAIDTWIRIIDGTVANDTVVEPLLTVDYFKSVGCESYQLVDNICYWVAKDDGLRDLLIFCKIVFGKNDAVSIKSA